MNMSAIFMIIHLDDDEFRIGTLDMAIKPRLLFEEFADMAMNQFGIIAVLPLYLQFYFGHNIE